MVARHTTSHLISIDTNGSTGGETTEGAIVLDEGADSIVDVVDGPSARSSSSTSESTSVGMDGFMVITNESVSTTDDGIVEDGGSDTNTEAGVLTVAAADPDSGIIGDSETVDGFEMAGVAAVTCFVRDPECLWCSTDDGAATESGTINVLCWRYTLECNASRLV